MIDRLKQEIQPRIRVGKGKGIEQTSYPFVL